MAFAVGRPVEISSRDRAVPDLMAAAALPNESAARRAQQLPQLAIKLRRHSGQRLLGFAQRGDLTLLSLFAAGIGVSTAKKRKKRESSQGRSAEKPA